VPAAPPIFAPTPAAGPVMPGRYLRERRERAGVSIEAAASITLTDPAIPHRDRVAMLREIEADTRGLTRADRPLIEQLAAAYPFDARVLWRLVAIAAGSPQPHPALCRLCLCSWTDACVSNGRPCGWSAHDVSICTTCAERMAAAAAADPLLVGVAA